MSCRLPDSISFTKEGSGASSGAYRNPVSASRYSSAGFVLAVALAVGTGVALEVTSAGGELVQETSITTSRPSHDRRNEDIWYQAESRRLGPQQDQSPELVRRQSRVASPR